MANPAPSYGGVLGQTANTNSALRVSQVQEQVMRGQNIMGRIEEKIKALLERLDPILSNVPPEQAGRGENSKTMLVGHANALSNHNDQLDSFDAVLGSILDRLEL